MPDRSKLERSLDDANAAVTKAAHAEPYDAKAHAEAARRAQNIRQTLRRHRAQMEGR